MCKHDKSVRNNELFSHTAVYSPDTVDTDYYHFILLVNMFYAVTTEDCRCCVVMGVCFMLGMGMEQN